MTGVVDVHARVRALRVLPVIVLDDAALAVPVADALAGGGLPIAEITMRTPAAIGAIEQIARDRPDVLVGAGTVLDVGQAAAALDAGARFIVAPGLNAAVVAFCQTREVPVFPGVVTPTEIEHARRLGVRTVKFFPAEAAGGARYLAAVAAPYRDMEFIPTGGIDRHRLAAYLATRGVVACGGSWMVADVWLRTGDLAAITAETLETVRTVRELAGR